MKNNSSLKRFVVFFMLLSSALSAPLSPQGMCSSYQTFGENIEDDEGELSARQQKKCCARYLERLHETSVQTRIVFSVTTFVIVGYIFFISLPWAKGSEG